MTDRFEEAVRQAALDLGATTELPTYHDAWRRGRRRRLVKRSALAAAGALVFVAALTVNLGRLPGSAPSESDDVAVEVAAATPTALATTAPVEVPTVESGPSPQIAEVPPATATASPTAVPTTRPPTTPTPAPGSGSSEPPAATSAPEAAAAPTAVPTPAVRSTPQPTIDAPEVAPTAPPDAFSLPEPTREPDTGATPEVAPPATIPPAPAADSPPAIAATGISGRPDAVVLTEQGAARGRGCDSDLDGRVDATCELLGDYPCTGNGDVSPGYAPIDDDGDGVVEVCRAVGLTICDTTGDGFGDTPCIIELGTDEGPGPAGPPPSE